MCESGLLGPFSLKFATTNHNGIGMNEPYKLQLAINMKGLPLILWASFCGAVARVFGKRGVFYEIVGQDVAGIDGFTATPPSKPTIPWRCSIPRIPTRKCAAVEDALGIACAVVDANDIDVEILGRSPP